MPEASGLSVAGLLSGPRGRRLCLELARIIDEHASTAIFHAAHDLDPGAGTSRVMFGVGGELVHPTLTVGDVAAEIGRLETPELTDGQLWDALRATVDSARYWQEPDGEDVLAATTPVRRALEPLAHAVVDSPLRTWWTTPMATVQHASAILHWPAPPTASPQDLLRAWRVSALEEEARAARERPADPTAMFSGEWWSIPPHGLPRSTRWLSGRGPVGIWLVEDGSGEDARSVEVEVPDALRVLEIDGPDDWAELCRRHPLRVTESRRHDWYRATGRRGPEWVLPDWAAVAEGADVVHVSVAGWLRAAGVAVELGDGVASVMAGWDPDAAFWLTVRPREVGVAAQWMVDPSSATWRRRADPRK